jgi:hypothetical protein
MYEDCRGIWSPRKLQHTSHEHHLHWQENRISALYLHQALLADAGEEMHDVNPFFVGKQNSHPGVLVQESMTWTGPGLGNEESGNGNETALYHGRLSIILNFNKRNLKGT